MVNKLYAERNAQRELAGNRRRLMKEEKHRRNGLFDPNSDLWGQHRFVQLRKMLLSSGKIEITEEGIEAKDEEEDTNGDLRKKGRPVIPKAVHISSFDDRYVGCGPKTEYDKCVDHVVESLGILDRRDES